jgi:hypothetical protein
VALGLAEFDAVRQNAQGKRLDGGDGSPLGGAVGQDPRQVRHLGDPAPVGFLLDFDGEAHAHEQSLLAPEAGWMIG